MTGRTTTILDGDRSRSKGLLPGWPLALAGSIAWASIMAASALAFLWHREWQMESALWKIVTLYFSGGLLAFLPAWVSVAWLDRRRPLSRAQRFSAAFMVFAGFTVVATAFLFSQYFRLYFAQWHRPLLSVFGILEFGYTSAAAVYYFCVGGLRQYLPLGLPALLAISLWWARKPR